MSAGGKPTLGVILLAHGGLGRVADLITYWRAGGAVVCVHVDAKCPSAELKARFDGDDCVLWVEPQSCRWGTWDLVAVTLDACRRVIDHLDEASHILLQSGDCLPCYPAADLTAHLQACAETDFIETRPAKGTKWVQGGPSLERFTRYYPISWQGKPRAFDWVLKLQRKARISRKIPLGLTPHLGAQWWCLRRATLSAILNDPRFKEWQRYFKWVWIPDESFFQTLTPLFADHIAPPLTWTRFDSYGKPFVLYHEHMAPLQDNPPWIARKIAPEATALWAQMGKGRYSHSGTLGAALNCAIDPWDQNSRQKKRAASNLGSLPDRITGGLRPYLVIIGDLPEDWHARATRPFERHAETRQWIGYAVLDVLRETCQHAPIDQPLILHIAPEDLHFAKAIIETDPQAVRLKTPFQIPEGTEPRKAALLQARVRDWAGISAHDMDAARQFMSLWWESAQKDEHEERF